MTEIKNVLIFGANGGTGVELVKQSLESGYLTSIFVHNKTDALGDLANRLVLFKGDAKDFNAVNSAVKGKDAVLVALGSIPGKKDQTLSKSTANIVRAMTENGVKRLVVETGAGLMPNKKLLPFFWRLTAALPPMKIMFDDKRQQEEVVQNSNLDWVIVRPANLTSGDRTNQYQVGESLKLKVSSKISRADVASIMLEQLKNDDCLHKAITVSN